MRIIAIIPAGGKGSRSGYSVPKQYLKISGKEMIAYTIDCFQKNRFINEIIVAADPAYFKIIDRIKKKYNFSKLIGVVKGGNERQDSVYSALKSIAAAEDDLICIHDAARPLLSEKILNEAIRTARSKGNAVVCVKAKDTLLLNNGKNTRPINRENIYYMQTPQIFRYKVLLNSIEKANKVNITATDESTVVISTGEKLNFVNGSVYNFKITTIEDISLLKKILK